MRVVGLDPELGAGLVDGGGLDRQQLHRVVAGEDGLVRGQRLAGLELARDCAEPALQAGECAAGGGGRHVDLQDVGGRAELGDPVGRQILPVAAIAPLAVDGCQVIELGRGHDAERQGVRHRVEAAAPVTIVVAPGQRIEAAEALAGAEGQPLDDAQHQRVAAQQRHPLAAEADRLAGDREIERRLGLEHLEEDVARRDLALDEVRRPEDEGGMVIRRRQGAEPGGDGRRCREGGCCGTLRLFEGKGEVGAGWLDQPGLDCHGLLASVRALQGQATLAARPCRPVVGDLLRCPRLPHRWGRCKASGPSNGLGRRERRPRGTES